MLTLRKRVFQWALFSRLAILTLSFVSNWLLPDHIADAFVGPRDPSDPPNKLLDPLVEFLFGGLVRWDAQYFLYVSLHGYSWEQTTAFFPLFPGLVHMGSLAIYTVLWPVLSLHSTAVLTAVTLNVLFFCLAARTLFDLSEEVLGSQRLAAAAAAAFCVSPASIFFTAPYSESLFAWLTFRSMLICQSSDENGILSLGFSMATRSNGLLNVAFPLHQFARAAWAVKAMPCRLLLMVSRLFVSIISILVPLLAYQFYCRSSFCGPRTTPHPRFIYEWASLRNIPLAGYSRPPWCNSFSIEALLPYLYVQRRYWNVGFMRYFQWKQLPNFLLAMPALILVWLTTAKYVCYCPRAVWTLGLKPCVIGAKLFPYMIHAAGLATFCFFNVHVQVATRMLASSTPLLYWVAAYAISDNSDLKKVPVETSSNNLEDDRSWLDIFFGSVKGPLQESAKWVRIYFVSYAVIGTILFSNFLPWT